MRAGSTRRLARSRPRRRGGAGPTTIGTALAALAVILGALGVTAVATSGIAASAEAPSASSTGPLDRALDRLVEDGTVTEQQADAVRAALAAELRDGPAGHGRGPWGGGHPLLDQAFQVAARAIGIGADALRDAVAGGTTVAEVAEDHGVEPSAVVDALVAAGQERIAAAVEDGDLTEEQAADALGRLADGAERFVESTLPPLGPGARGHGPGGHGRGRWGLGD